MPNYDYHCEKCGRTFEAYQSMKDNAFSTCPKEKCEVEPWGEGHVKRLLGTGAGLIFKGSGFYITDYRSENYKKGAKGDSSGAKADAAPKTVEPKTSTPKPSAD